MSTETSSWIQFDKYGALILLPNIVNKSNIYVDQHTICSIYVYMQCCPTHTQQRPRWDINTELQTLLMELHVIIID